MVPVRRMPLRWIWPRSGEVSPAMMRRRLDFPVPDGPMRARVSPGWSVRLMSWRMGVLL